MGSGWKEKQDKVVASATEKTEEEGSKKLKKGSKEKAKKEKSKDKKEKKKEKKQKKEPEKDSDVESGKKHNKKEKKEKRKSRDSKSKQKDARYDSVMSDDDCGDVTLRFKEIKMLDRQIRRLKSAMEDAEAQKTEAIEIATRRKERAKAQQEDLIENMKLFQTFGTVHTLKQENKLIEKKQMAMDKKFQALSKRNLSLLENHKASSTKMMEMAPNAISLKEKNDALQDEHDEIHEEFVRTNQERSEVGVTYEQVALQRLEAQKGMVSILKLLRNHCKDKKIVDFAYDLARDCEVNSEKIMSVVEEKYGEV